MAALRFLQAHWLGCLALVLVVLWLAVAAFVYFLQVLQHNKPEILVALGWPVWIVMYWRGSFRG